jgi:hypothetical protein
MSVDWGRSEMAGREVAAPPIDPDGARHLGAPARDCRMGEPGAGLAITLLRFRLPTRTATGRNHNWPHHLMRNRFRIASPRRDCATLRTCAQIERPAIKSGVIIAGCPAYSRCNVAACPRQIEAGSSIGRFYVLVRFAKPDVILLVVDCWLCRAT